MNQEKKLPHNFCETPEEKCTMNYCDENGCQNRKRRLVVENKLPTAQEIIDKHALKVFPEKYTGVIYHFITGAMEEYKDLHTAPLQARIEELEKENERLTKLAEKRKRQLEAACADSKYFNDECDRLRDALEGLYNYCKDHRDLKGYIKFEHLLKKAKEALKGETK